MAVKELFISSHFKLSMVSKNGHAGAVAEQPSEKQPVSPEHGGQGAILEQPIPVIVNCCTWLHLIMAMQE
eukprot:4780969-Amphidinium_carterae.1